MNKATLVIFDGHGKPMTVSEQTIPSLTAGEILVKNLYTTICGSDLHTYCGLRNEKTPTVLGHEIVGKIVAFSDTHTHKDYLGNTLNLGDTVTWSIFSSDPASPISKAGMPQKAEGLFKYGHAQVIGDDALHGGLATHCILKKGTAIIGISQKIPLPVAAIINCAVATVAGALRLAGDVSKKKILITGSGLLGIVCAAMCKDAGAEIIHVADINLQRLQQVSDFGADKTYLLTGPAIKLPEDIDVAFDMSGSPDAMETGLKALGIGGVAVWIGAVFHTRGVTVDPETVIRKLITIKGLHNYNFDDFVYAVNFITANHNVFPFDSIVAKEFGLPDAEEAFKYAIDNKPLRVGIHIDHQSKSAYEQ